MPASRRSSLAPGHTEQDRPSQERPSVGDTDSEPNVPRRLHTEYLKLVKALHAGNETAADVGRARPAASQQAAIIGRTWYPLALGVSSIHGFLKYLFSDVFFAVEHKDEGQNKGGGEGVPWLEPPAETLFSSFGSGSMTLREAGQSQRRGQQVAQFIRPFEAIFLDCGAIFLEFLT